MGNLQYRSTVWICQHICADSAFFQDTCHPIALFKFMMYHNQLSWGHYAIYITWLHRRFPSEGVTVFRYLKKHYSKNMYSFSYLARQYRTMERKLSASYVDPTEPGSPGGIAKFAKAHKIPQSHAKKELQQVLSYTPHKPQHRRFKTLPTLVFNNINEQFVMDLVDLQKLAKYNKGYKYLLTVIDVLSKFAWVEPLKTKSATVMLEALQRLWARLGDR